jgi:hypothetical protein
MEPDSAMLAQEIVLVLWITAFFNAGLWSFLEDRAFNIVRRRRSGKSGSRAGRIVNMFRLPWSVPTIGRDASSKLEALLNTSDDVEVERQRRKTLIAAATVGGVAFLGLPALSVVARVLRFIFPGTLLVWAAAFDLILIAGWVRHGIHSHRDPDAPTSSVLASAAGISVCTASLIALIALWRSGGVPM